MSIQPIINAKTFRNIRESKFLKILDVALGWIAVVLLSYLIFNIGASVYFAAYVFGLSESWVAFVQYSFYFLAFCTLFFLFYLLDVFHSRSVEVFLFLTALFIIEGYVPSHSITFYKIFTLQLSFNFIVSSVTIGCFFFFLLGYFIANKIINSYFSKKSKNSEANRISKTPLKIHDYIYRDILGKEELGKFLSPRKWVQQDTAILVIHGIGHQRPVQTLDQFARGLLKSLKKFGFSVNVSHQVARKSGGGDRNSWFDNYLSFSPAGDENSPKLDVYEYYWANLTENKAGFFHLKELIGNVSGGAKKFYDDQKRIAEKNSDESSFFRHGRFMRNKYFLLINLGSKSLVILEIILSLFFRLISFVAGKKIIEVIKNEFSPLKARLLNRLNDITIYNTTDEKSAFYDIRKTILDGSVNALKYLLEAENANDQPKYPKILVAAHSLGSQVAFDTFNRLNFLACHGEIIELSGVPVNNRFAGFVSFGSPLDKIAFFFRDRIGEEEYLRRQILQNFHGFKVKDLDGKTYPFQIGKDQKFNKLFEDIPWLNFYDKKDYVSGGLDYYGNLTNINARFTSNMLSFTHENYWESDEMFGELLVLLINPDLNLQMPQPSVHGTALTEAMEDVPVSEI
jgi:hypothetical protein